MNTKIDFELPKQTRDIFDNFLSNYEFHKIGNDTILFWQPYEEEYLRSINDPGGLTLDGKMEIILEHDGITIDSHWYIDHRYNYNDSIRYLKFQEFLKKDYEFLYKNSSHTLISIYPVEHQRNGYCLISGIGNPVLISELKFPRKNISINTLNTLL